MEKKFIALFAAILFLLSFSFAQSNETQSPCTVQVDWIAPAQYDNGTPLNEADIVSYLVFKSVNGGAFEKIATVNAPTKNYSDTINNGVSACYSIVAVDNAGNESNKSIQSCVNCGLACSTAYSTGKFDVTAVNQSVGVYKNVEVSLISPTGTETVCVPGKFDINVSENHATHKGCIAGACIEIQGEGEDNCDACPQQHLDCTGIQQCTIVDGAGSNNCFSAEDCCDPADPNCKHNECSGTACLKEVPGPGASKCLSDIDCVPTSHTECIDKACISIDGPGLNMCENDSGCQFYYKCDYSTQTCQQVQGDSPNECGSNSDCLPSSHLACALSACLLVNTPGVNECATSSDCLLKNKEHLECTALNACAIVPGAGKNTCFSGEDCSCDSSVETCSHLDCVNNSCTTVSGAGADLCESNTDCSQNTHTECNGDACIMEMGAGKNWCVETCNFHLECRESSCVQVKGTGINSCSSSKDCSKENKKESVALLTAKWEKQLSVGSVQIVNVQINDQPIEGAEVKLVSPNGVEEKLVSNNLGIATSTVKEMGEYSVLVAKNGETFEGKFAVVSLLVSATGVISESVKTLFGDIGAESPLKYLLLILLALIAGILAFNKSKYLFSETVKPISQRRKESAVKVGISVFIFLLPLVAGKFLGADAGIFLALIEIAVIFLLDVLRLRKLKRETDLTKFSFSKT